MGDWTSVLNVVMQAFSIDKSELLEVTVSCSGKQLEKVREEAELMQMYDARIGAYGMIVATHGRPTIDRPSRRR